jgi:hypothetical protein
MWGSVSRGPRSGGIPRPSLFVGGFFLVTYPLSLPWRASPTVRLGRALVAPGFGPARRSLCHGRPGHDGARAGRPCPSGQDARATPTDRACPRMEPITVAHGYARGRRAEPRSAPFSLTFNLDLADVGECGCPAP